VTDSVYADKAGHELATVVGSQPAGVLEERRWNGYTVPQRHRRLDCNQRIGDAKSRRRIASTFHCTAKDRHVAAEAVARRNELTWRRKIHEQKEFAEDSN